MIVVPLQTGMFIIPRQQVDKLFYLEPRFVNPKAFTGFLL